MIGFNGGLIGKLRTYLLGGANSGVWSLPEYLIAKLTIVATGGTESFIVENGINYKLHTFTVAAFYALVVVHPGIALEDAEAIRHQRWVADASFYVLVVGELSHELLVCMAKWMADDVLRLEALTQSRDQAALE